MTNYSQPDSSSITFNPTLEEEIKKVREWKAKLRIIGRSYKSQLISLISEDLEKMKGKRETLDLKTTRGLA